MISQTKKINLIHSIIFFFMIGTILIFASQGSVLKIPSIICLFLILTIGISHGSLDHIKGKKILKILKVKKIYIFYLAYTLIALSVIGIWLVQPLLVLLLFLTISSYHFGKEDAYFLVEKKSKLNELIYFLKGLLIIVSPLLFHFEETINIFNVLLIKNEKFFIFLNYLEGSKSLYVILFLSISANFYIFLKRFKIMNFLLLFDFLSILILNYCLTPLIAFTIYFCFLHSVRHTISLIKELDSKNFKNGLFKFLEKATPLTLFTGIMYISCLLYLNNFFELDDAILKVIFIGLASLTFPHILLEYAIKKNGK